MKNIKASFKDTSRLGKLLVFLVFGGGLFWLMLSYLGFVGMSVAGIEAFLWLGLGLFLLSETLGENAKDLQKLDPVVSVETFVAALVFVFGVSLITEWSVILAVMNPYKAYLLGVGLIFGLLETQTKL